MANKHGFKPYCYLIGWSSLDRWYYGRRIANKKPSKEDFWIGKYKTSSNVVREYRKIYGEPDVIQIRREFDNEFKARIWEEKVIDRMDAVRSERWLNKNNGGRDFYRESYVMSPKQKDRISKSLKGRKRPKFSDEWKANLSKGKIGKKYPGKGLGRKHSQDGIENCRKAANKRWEIRERIQHPNTRSAVLKMVICPHCSKEGSNMIMKRWHFDNCKEKQ